MKNPIIIPLCGIDDSMVGFSIKGWQIKKLMYFSFILRVTILEMLIESSAELSYRIRHYVAVLLGRSKAESVEIANNFKKLYNARSKFLHDGKQEEVTEEYMELAYEYARRVIANLLCVTDDIKTIRTTLEQAGYGDNPYNVMF